MAPPRKFATPEELQAKVDEFFDACDNDHIQVDSTRKVMSKPRPYTLSGLCVHLGISKQCWSEYCNREDYKHIGEQARLKVEAYTEQAALVGAINPVFAIFSLKNNFQWKDTIDVNTDKTTDQLSEGEIKGLIKERRLRLVDGSKKEQEG